jgi:hypothetical protein
MVARADFLIGMSLISPIDMTSGCEEGLQKQYVFTPGVDSEMRDIRCPRHYPMGHPHEIEIVGGAQIYKNDRPCTTRKDIHRELNLTRPTCLIHDPHLPPL